VRRLFNYDFWIFQMILTHRQHLVNAVRQVASGKEYWSIPIPDDFMDVRLGAYGSGDPELSIYETLTRREREILAMTAQGNTSRQIAVALSISPRTAETHRTNIGRKLGLRTQADLIRYAIEHGLE
jgi:DNA-binding NarL/FixJ family response regulator